jgi:hypothetical protein
VPQSICKAPRNFSLLRNAMDFIAPGLQSPTQCISLRLVSYPLSLSTLHHSLPSNFLAFPRSYHFELLQQSQFLLSFLVLLWHNTTKVVGKMTARSVPKSLASVVEELELRRPTLVTKEFLGEILSEHRIGLNPRDVAHRLQKHGWLLSLRTEDAWEFAPAARAGRFDSGDPLIEFRATLHHRPDLPAAVAYESAAWLHNLMRRSPEVEVIAIKPGVSHPPALGVFRVTRMWGQLPPIEMNELPVWGVETLLVLMGQRPTAFRAWPTVMEWLPEAVSRADKVLLFKELQGRKLPTWARVGYLLEAGGGEEIGESIQGKVKLSRRGPFYLGRRIASGKYDKRWDVIDSILLPKSH